MTDLVSSLIHLLAAGAFLLAGPHLLRQVGRSPALRAAGLLHLFTVVFLFTMSGLFHLSEHLYGPAAAVTESFRRLDHIGIWLMLAGFFTVPHLIVFEGRWRWVPLAVVWTAAWAGVAFKVLWFGTLPLTANWFLYAAVASVGVASTIKGARARGLWFARWLWLCWGSYALGSVFLLAQPADLILGLIGHHELWHVAVVVGTIAHWRFCLQIAPLAEGSSSPEPVLEAAPQPA